MDKFQKLDTEKRKHNLCRVELHVHLDGSIRHETMWELLRKKKLPMPGDGSLKAVREAVLVQRPRDLCGYLAGFSVFMPAFISDVEAMERVAYEFVQDKYNDGVLYVEVRYSPHLLVDSSCSHVGVRDIIKAVNRGFKKGEANFPGITVRSILCCIRTSPEWCDEVVELCDEFRDDGVVGIDISGDEMQCRDSNGKFFIAPEFIRAFEKAKQKGIHRTVHAGEAGPPCMIKMSLEQLHAERIGHGYHLPQDAELMEYCEKAGTHFEVCPHSSICTGSVPLGTEHHPILQFLENGIKFSINTDDFAITGTTLTNEYKLLQQWGFRESDIVRANVYAAKDCFLPENEKMELMQKLRKTYGFCN